jgi:hypothetical protein
VPSFLRVPICRLALGVLHLVGNGRRNRPETTAPLRGWARDVAGTITLLAQSAIKRPLATAFPGRWIYAQQFC